MVKLNLFKIGYIIIFQVILVHNLDITCVNNEPFTHTFKINPERK